MQYNKTMKYLFIILVALASCKKEDSYEYANLPTIPTQCDVTFTVKGRTDSRKHITGELWSVVQGTRDKAVLVGRIDTIIESSYFSMKLVQSVRPVVHCIASMRVQGMDTLSISISSDAESVRRSNSCMVSDYSLDDIYLNIYKPTP